jgi:K+-sensing histidine kinase KdpD
VRENLFPQEGPVRRWPKGIKTFAGAMLNAAAALALGWLLFHTQFKEIAPLLFTVVPILVARKCGLLSSILGALLAVLIFSYCFSAPVGSFHVNSEVARKSLAWMLLGSLVFPFLLFPPGKNAGHRRT